LLHGFRLPLKQSARKHPSQNLKTKPSGSLKTPSMRFQAALIPQKNQKTRSGICIPNRVLYFQAAVNNKRRKAA
jgi:hypothetical protein